MRTLTIVAMADTHGYQQAMAVPDGDVLIHAGDLSGRGTLPQLTEQRDWLLSLPHAHKVIVAGNHDFLFEDQPQLARALFGPPLIYLQDSGTTVAGLKLWGSPWQPWFYDWAFNLKTPAELDARWQLIPEGLDVLVTHGPPHGYGDRCDDGRRVGCGELLKHLRRTRPRLHLYGHIHEDGGQWQVGDSRLVNVTTAECERAPTVLTLSVD